MNTLVSCTVHQLGRKLYLWKQNRKRQRELVYKKKKEFIDNCINAVVVTVLLAIGLGILGLVLYFIGAKQGKW